MPARMTARAVVWEAAARSAREDINDLTPRSGARAAQRNFFAESLAQALAEEDAAEDHCLAATSEAPIVTHAGTIHASLMPAGTGATGTMRTIGAVPRLASSPARALSTAEPSGRLQLSAVPVGSERGLSYGNGSTTSAWTGAYPPPQSFASTDLGTRARALRPAPTLEAPHGHAQMAASGWEAQGASVPPQTWTCTQSPRERRITHV